MSYEVTATRKRPQTFDELSGQEFVASTLKNSLTSGRLAHAYLFSGPRGVGKTSAARILAKALNCEQGPTDMPCGRCSSCLGITRGNSLDVIEIDGASNTSVTDVREIKDEVLFAPNSSRYKVYIIDEVHMLSNSAFNALLKTIEEPPPYIVFIFATTELHKVPATIKSRCQQFNFRLIPPADIRALLDSICTETGISAESDALYWIAKESTGSLRDAYTLFDQVVSFSGSEITLAKIRDKLGLVGLDSLNELADILSGGNTKEAFEYIDGLLSSGVSVEQLIVDLSEYYRNLLFLKHGVTRESILGFGPERFSRKAVSDLTATQLEKAVEILLDVYRNIRYSLNQRFELELLVCRLAALPSFFSHREMMEQLQDLRSRISGGDPGKERKTGGISAFAPAVAAGKPDRNQAQKPREETLQPQEQSPKRHDAVQAPPDQISPREDVSARLSAASPSRQEDRDDEGGDGEDEYADPVQPEVAGQIPDDLLQRLAAVIRKKKLALSSALEKAVSWKFEKETLYLFFDSSFSENFVRQDLGEVAEKARAILSRPVKVVTEIKESSDSGRPGKDDQVEIVKRVFRGQIIQGE